MPARLPAATKFELAATLAEMASTLRMQNVNLGKVGRYSPALRDSLSIVSREFSDEARKYIDLVQQDVLGKKCQTPPDEYFNLGIKLIRAGSSQKISTCTGVQSDSAANMAASVEQAQRAGGVMQEIRRSSQHVAMSIEEISAALREQATASNEIAKHVERIAQMADDNKVAVSSNASAAVEMQLSAERLREGVARFKTA